MKELSDFYERVCAPPWCLPIQTSARAGSMATTPAVPIVLCKGTVMCCLETPSLLRLCQVLVPRSEMKRNSFSVHPPLFFSAVALQMFLVFPPLSSHRLASLPKPQSRLWCRTSLFSSPAYIRWLSSFHPSPTLFYFCKSEVKLVHHNTLTKWILHFSLILRLLLQSGHSWELAKIKGDGN